MIERGFGKIINISTNGRTMARENYTPYGPSKAFVEACTRAWASELKGTRGDDKRAAAGRAGGHIRGRGPAEAVARRRRCLRR